MDVFVAGATGRVVPLLVAAGHRVRAVSRSDGAAEGLAAAGATPVSVDLFDSVAVLHAVHGHDAVVDLATKASPFGEAFRGRAWAANQRLRGEASRILVGAAIAKGASVFVQESIVHPYADRDGLWTRQSDTPFSPSPHTAAVKAAEIGVARFRAAQGRGIVLRLGMLYSLDSDNPRGMVRMARSGGWLVPTWKCCRARTG